ncbi:2-hydroxychromene-2-carboxylate isomerase [Gammaproteobacteria bacterium AS21]
MSQLTIDYYFWLSSDWSYLGHRRLTQLAELNGAIINYKPVQMTTLFELTGGTLLSQRSQQRQDYRVTELERWKLILNMPIITNPSYFPVNNDKALSLLVGALSAGKEVNSYIESVMHAVWMEERDIANPAVLVEIATRSGYSLDEINKWMVFDNANFILTENAKEAARVGVFGAPSYVVEGEVFWGQDRLELLSVKIASSKK